MVWGMDLHFGQGEGHMDIQLFQHVLLKSLSFLHSLAFVLCPKTIVFSYCTLLLFFYVVQHCENKRRTDKDQTLWKINKTFNIIRPQFNSPCSSSATTSFFQSPPPFYYVGLLSVPWLCHWLSCLCAFPQVLPSAWDTLFPVNHQLPC